MELDDYDTEQVGNTGLSELEDWMCLLNSWIHQGAYGITTNSTRFKAITSMMADPFCIHTVVLKVFEHNYCEIIDRPYNYFSCSTFGSILFQIHLTVAYSIVSITNNYNGLSMVVCNTR